MSKVSDVFLLHGFFILQLNVREHIIPHIPCGKVSEDNYCLFYASHLKQVQSSFIFIVLRAGKFYGKFIIFALSTCNNSEYSCQKFESLFLHMWYCML